MLLSVMRTYGYGAPAFAQPSGLSRKRKCSGGVLEALDAGPEPLPDGDHVVPREVCTSGRVFLQPDELGPDLLHFGVVGEDARRHESELAAVLDDLASLVVADQRDRPHDLDDVTDTSIPRIVVKPRAAGQILADGELLLNQYRAVTSCGNALGPFLVLGHGLRQRSVLLDPLSQRLVDCIAPE